jgi:hypothetical protein
MEAPQFIVWADVQVTRRKHRHIITTPEGKTVFQSYHLGEIMEHLALEECSEYEIQTAARRWRVRPVEVKEEKE